MTINPNNLTILEKIENKLENEGFNFIEKTSNLSIDSLKEYRSLQITIIGLSVTIAGVVIPLLLSKDVINNESIRLNLLTSIVLFGMNIIFGVISHSTNISKERESLWKNLDLKLNEMSSMLDRVRDIKKIENNNEAGVALNVLSEEVKNRKIISPKRIYSDLVDAIFFGLFILAIFFTFISIIKILF